MDVQIRPLETLYCFGYDKLECSSCANRQTWERIRTTNRINQSAAPIDFTQCDLTSLTHRIEALA